MVTETNTIPKGWDSKPLSIISTMNGRIGWQGLKQSEFTQNPDEPFLITGMNFKNGIIRWDEVYHIPKKRYEEAKNIQLKKNDILITKDGTIGKLLFIDNIPYPNKASLNSHLLVFRPIIDQYIPKFLFYHLHSKSFLEHVEQNKSGTTFFGITEKAIGKYIIHLPSILEQSAIAQVLSDTNDLIQQLDYLITKKENIKQGAMQELLTGKRRLCGFKKDWEIKKFIEIFTTIPTKNFQIKTSEYQDFGLYPVIDQGKQKIIGYSDKKEKVFKCTEKGIVIFGDHTRTIKFVNFNFVIGADGTQILTTLDNSLPKFFYYQLKTKIIPETGYNRHYKFLKELYLMKPELDEQIAITNILSDMDAEIEELEKKRDKYIMIKNGMMQKLLTGEIRVK